MRKAAKGFAYKSAFVCLADYLFLWSTMDNE